MLRVSSVRLLLLCGIISGASSQVKEYDCPEYDANLCSNPIYEYRNILECKSDDVCGIGQKCCNQCKYGYKVCTNIVMKKYLTNQDEYLKNKYCPKVKPCLTLLKYDLRYRCLSNEVCGYGYKCCKSDCYIHKVCVVPIDKEGVEVIPPFPISTTIDKEITPTVTSTSTKLLQTTLLLPITTLSTTTEEETDPVSTSTKFIETTFYVPTTTPYTSYPEEGGKTSDKVTAIKPSTITYFPTNSNTKQPVATSTRQSITVTITPETSTEIQETTQRTTDYTRMESPTGTTKFTTITAKDIIDTSTPISLSTTISSTQTSTKFNNSDDGNTDDTEDSDDEDDFGSGDGETQSTRTRTVTSVTEKDITTVGSSMSLSTTNASPTTIRQKIATTQTSTEFTTTSPFSLSTKIVSTTTIPEVISTKIIKSTPRSTTFTNSDDGNTDDTEDSDDEDDFGSGDGETQSTRTTTVTSVTEKDNTTVGSSMSLSTTTASPTTIRQEISTTQKSTAFTMTPPFSLPTKIVSITTSPEAVSTKIIKSTLTSTKVTNDGSTDDTEDSDDEDDFGSGDGETQSTRTSIVTSVTEKDITTVGSSMSLSTASPTKIRQKISTTQTSTEFTTTPPFPLSTKIVSTTSPEVLSTKIIETILTSTKFNNSDDGITDDTEDGDDEDDFGSGDSETQSTRTTTVTSVTKTDIYTTRSSMSLSTTTASPTTIHEISTTGFTSSANGITVNSEEGNDLGSGGTFTSNPKTTTILVERENVSTTELQISSSTATIHQTTSTKIPESTQTSTRFTDDEEDDDSEDIGSGDGTNTDKSTSKSTKVTSSSDSNDKDKVTADSESLEDVTTTQKIPLTSAPTETITKVSEIGVSTIVSENALTDKSTDKDIGKATSKSIKEPNEKVSETSKITVSPLTTERDFSFDQEENVIRTTMEEASKNSSVSQQLPVTTEESSSGSLKPKPANTPTPVKFDYEDGFTTIEETEDKKTSNSSNTINGVSNSTSDLLPTDISSSSTTEEAINANTVSRRVDVTTITTDSNEKSNGNTEENFTKDSLPIGGKTEVTKITEVKESVSNGNIKDFSQENLLSEGSGTNGVSNEEEDDDDNEDDVDEDIRRNFNHSLVKES